VTLVIAIAVVAALFILLRVWNRDGPAAAPGPKGTTRSTINTAATGTIAPTTAAGGAGGQVATGTPQQEQTLACLRTNESGNNYTAASPDGQYLGAYQFDQTTWNATATHAGYTNLVGVPPNQATPAQQDSVALALMQWQGTWPWNGDPCV